MPFFRRKIFLTLFDHVISAVNGHNVWHRNYNRRYSFYLIVSEYTCTLPCHQQKVIKYGGPNGCKDENLSVISFLMVFSIGVKLSASVFEAFIWKHQFNSFSFVIHFMFERNFRVHLYSCIHPFSIVGISWIWSMELAPISLQPSQEFWIVLCE